MNTYSIYYSTLANGTIEINAGSKDEALEIFENITFDELFELKDLYRGIQVDEIIKN